MVLKEDDPWSTKSIKILNTPEGRSPERSEGEGQYKANDRFSPVARHELRPTNALVELASQKGRATQSSTDFLMGIDWQIKTSGCAQSKEAFVMSVLLE